MQYRKLIKFGDSSFVVSLPKDWVERNALKKGDVIGIEMGSKNELFLLPKSKPERQLTEIIINLDENNHLEHLKTFIISAYLKNFDMIHVTGKDLVEHASKVRDIVHDLASMEIVEQTSKRMTIRIFADPMQLSIPTLIRRLEIMIGSMLDDAKTSLTSSSMKEYAYQKEEDVTRIVFLVYKTLRKALTDPEIATALKMEPLDILHYWNVTHSLEETADQAKRICKYLDEGKIKNKKEIEEIMQKAIDHYNKTFKAYRTKDRVVAVEALHDRFEIMGKCREYLNENTERTSLLVIDKIRRIVTFTGNVANVTVDT